MAKRFKSKKIKRRRTIYMILIASFAFALSLSFFSSFFQKKEVLDFLMNTTLFSKSSISEETPLLDFLLDYTIGKSEGTDEIYDGTKSTQEYTPDPNPTENKKDPIFYIYNTHQGEEYQFAKTNDYQVTPTVMLASYKLREELNKRGLNTIVETTPISEILKINNWNYASSYKASRLLMEDALKKNPSLKYFIDLHRDSLSYENSILTFENKTYAKILFVIGTDHDNYQKNLEFATQIHEKLNQQIQGISRGILKKGGKGVNGIYNQDFSSQTLLFEIGGEYNKMSEVSNTLILLADTLKDFVG